ncbi:uncharacterized protein LOC124619430 [Schistocerca americana]|uniref:uncharacterized protein LOC124619430 n=1 Tax=Schistocerca americana TaxID=7009 RepID=UPI001F4FCCCA|nr:uncharacterized protein LOC124619430 [Schistocerca americana]XP_047119558.1 uncharacterized protein LOC124802674 [Schistocerca piceifrons]XP_049763972.1 uncharacterized protein LOC126092424 [Schistocerca cancellata]XP_049834633.1 uncharacterized protein LOC126278511 [Schistocerca gregaria]XP_049940288.1 uncharacterized protein LOC126416581 [Schistocerca serialis cubense]
MATSYSRTGLHVLFLCAIYLTTEATFTVELVMPRYVYRGRSAVLQCNYSVHLDVIHKVEWLRGEKKLFQFIRGRSPPFKEHHVHGVHIDRNRSDERQLVLRDVHFNAQGPYSCEVSTLTPIFTRRSEEKELTVIQPQTRAPVVRLNRPHYRPGDTLRANCSSGSAKPAPHIVWIVNGASEHGGRQNDSYHPGAGGGHLSRSTSQLSLLITEDHAGTLTITCRASVPGFVIGPQRDIVDTQEHTLKVEVEVPRQASCASCGCLLASPLHLLCLVALLHR